ncbi:MAG: peptidylprolyl isomerase [Cyclobacteriaceae bacterium]|jgi:peptidyl-prolyl cis-trans isomerase SurA|nr:peptidylprolyl isomerase [Flammeovirgaceae bacterium]
MKKLPSEGTLRSIISSLLLLTPWLAQAQPTQPDGSSGFVIDKIIAKVDNYIVLKSELEGAYQNYLAEGNPASGNARCGMLNRLIVNKLLVAKAEIDSVTVSDEEVDMETDQRMQMILQNSGTSPEQLEQAYGKTLVEIKIELRDQIREQKLAREMTSKITKDLTITPAEVKRFFNKIPADSLPFYSSDVEVAQIVRVAKVSEVQKQEARQRLVDLRNRILGGENFNDLARKYSEDPSAQYNGGEMGYVGRGAMVPSFEAMAFKLREGEISQPFESPFGFHIMQLIDRRGNEYNSRHILISAVPSANDIDRARQYLDSLRRKIVKDSIKFDVAAKEYSDDQATKGLGGYFTDQDGSTRISMREIDPVVYLAIDTMKVGSVCQPMTYRTEQQKDAVRILYFKNKLPPHQANLKDDWSRIQSAALAEKRDRILDKWFQKSRGDVFITIDPEFDSCNILE